MAIKVAEIAEIIGFKIENEETTTAEQIKAFMDEKFVSREHAPKDEKITKAVFGKVLGSARTKAKKLFELDGKEVDGKDIEDIFEDIHAKHTAALAAAKEAGGVGKDKRVADLEALLADKDKSIAAYKTGLSEKEAKIVELNTTYDTNLKNYKKTDKIEKLKSALPFIDDYGKKEVLRTGFESIIHSKYKFDLNDRDDLEVFTSDGNPIKHPKKTGEFLKPDELLYQVAEEQGLLKKNNGTQEKKTLFIPGFTDKQEDPGGGQFKSKVHPNARRKAAGATT